MIAQRHHGQELESPRQAPSWSPRQAPSWMELARPPPPPPTGSAKALAARWEQQLSSSASTPRGVVPLAKAPGRPIAASPAKPAPLRPAASLHAVALAAAQCEASTSGASAPAPAVDVGTQQAKVSRATLRLCYARVAPVGTDLEHMAATTASFLDTVPAASSSASASAAAEPQEVQQAVVPPPAVYDDVPALVRMLSEQLDDHQGRERRPSVLQREDTTGFESLTAALELEPSVGESTATPRPRERRYSELHREDTVGFRHEPICREATLTKSPEQCRESAREKRAKRLSKQLASEKQATLMGLSNAYRPARPSFGGDLVVPDDIVDDYARPPPSARLVKTEDNTSKSPTMPNLSSPPSWVPPLGTWGAGVFEGVADGELPDMGSPDWSTGNVPVTRAIIRTLGGGFCECMHKPRPEPFSSPAPGWKLWGQKSAQPHPAGSPSFLERFQTPPCAQRSLGPGARFQSGKPPPGIVGSLVRQFEAASGRRPQDEVVFNKPSSLFWKLRPMSVDDSIATMSEYDSSDDGEPGLEPMMEDAAVLQKEETDVCEMLSQLDVDDIDWNDVGMCGDSIDETVAASFKRVPDAPIPIVGGSSIFHVSDIVKAPPRTVHFPEPPTGAAERVYHKGHYALRERSAARQSPNKGGA
eukprot:gnl/TRDRNA2_/TRDRNA2_175118_c1_seq1.p1 gnl/TRDRNA2_/TRDRNA2_175118_c1~~gnl/TRDRNA2_/TRDRNA2_175118_c1_seq1.p1  ORF type:complete len:709 (+),score=130.25 gnl/TRDRNA2_/TRDRNA2_175118_c1_seq1:191-2128(+)